MDSDIKVKVLAGLPSGDAIEFMDIQKITANNTVMILYASKRGLLSLVQMKNGNILDQAYWSVGHGITGAELVIMNNQARVVVWGKNGSYVLRLQ
jgi:hypothetical protein